VGVGAGVLPPRGGTTPLQAATSAEVHLHWANAGSGFRAQLAASSEGVAVAVAVAVAVEVEVEVEVGASTVATVGGGGEAGVHPTTSRRSQRFMVPSVQAPVAIGWPGADDALASHHS